MPTQRLTPEIIAAAIQGFEEQKRRLDTQIRELRAMLPTGSTASTATPEGSARKGRKLSAAARRRMALGQKARWAKKRDESEPSALAAQVPPKAKSRISEAGMRRIIAATKKRWALKRAEAARAAQASQKKVPAKKAAVKASRAKAAKNSGAKTGKPVVHLAANTAA